MRRSFDRFKLIKLGWVSDADAAREVGATEWSRFIEEGKYGIAAVRRLRRFT